jgi:hypothetical protein
LQLLEPVADERTFVFRLPLWYVGSRTPSGITKFATGRVGLSDCLLVFTDVALARQSVRENEVTRPRVVKLATPHEVLDLLEGQLPLDITHIAFDPGGVGQAVPAVVSWQALASKMRPLADS